LHNYFTKTSILTIARVYLAIVICWQIAINTGIRDIWVVRLLDNFGGWLYLPLVFLLPCLYYRQIRKQLLVLLIVPFLLFWWEYHWCVLPKFAPSNGAKSLRVMTWNVRYDNPQPQSIAAVIKSQQPDIVAIQELVGSTASVLQQSLSQDFPYQLIPANFEFGIFSKYPLKSSQPAALDPSVSRFLEVRISVGDREVELIDVHLPIPTLTTKKLGFVPIPVDYNTDRQATIYPLLLDRIEKIDKPFLVVGDFNTSDRDRYYRLLNRSMNNAFQKVGWGFGFTFPLKSPVAIPLVRIDHIFYSSQWQAQSAWTDRGIGSDHQYLVANLQLD
jgi:vancomycin resistance protein VanJ